MKPDPAAIQKLSRVIVSNVIAELGLDLGDWWREKCAISIQSTLTAHISMMEVSSNGCKETRAPSAQGSMAVG